VTHLFLQLHWLLRHFDFVERLCVVSCTLCSGACFSKRRNRIRAPDAKRVDIHVQEASNRQQCTLLHNAQFSPSRKPRQVSLASHTVSSNPPHSCFNISSSTTVTRLAQSPCPRLLARFPPPRRFRCGPRTDTAGPGGSWGGSARSRTVQSCARSARSSQDRRPAPCSRVPESALSQNARV